MLCQHKYGHKFVSYLQILVFLSFSGSSDSGSASASCCFCCSFFWIRINSALCLAGTEAGSLRVGALGLGCTELWESDVCRFPAASVSVPSGGREGKKINPNLSNLVDKGLSYKLIGSDLHAYSEMQQK